MTAFNEEKIQRAWARAQGRNLRDKGELPDGQQITECIRLRFLNETMEKARMLLAIGIYMTLNVAPWLGVSSPHSYLVRELGLSERTAYEYCQVGLKLLEFEFLAQAFASAQLSYSKVRKILRYMTKENELELVDLASNNSFDGLEQALGGRQKKDDGGNERKEGFRIVKDPETGWSKTVIDLNPMHTAEFEAALKVAFISLTRSCSAEEAQRIADGLDTEAEMKEQAAEEDANAYDYEPTEPEEKEHTSFTVDDILESPEDQLIRKKAMESGEVSHDEKKQAVSRFGRCVKRELLPAFFGMVTMTLSQPRSQVRAPGAEVTVILRENGTLALPEQFGAEAKDIVPFIWNAAYRFLWVDRNGNPMALGRRRRLVSKAQEKALLDLWNHRCAMPGCTHTQFLEFHHIKEWQDGGETNADNLIPLCSGCHALVTDGLIRIFIDSRNPQLVRFQFRNGDCFTSIGRKPPMRDAILPYGLNPFDEEVRYFVDGKTIPIDDLPEPAGGPQR
ncbi:HNH endonuclease [Corynebacterium glucuronolyticum]|uniref:HNH endonuclease n=3 Tax=Corynebacterium glucuronolyticum TaxID=39791 RepID=A0AAX1L8E1_9CORY|nr:HNH endonuclease signature motif containing protein [Corynebacterium glucuronolyticum]EEI61855.1 HNH endonuclease domain protein [Corynebacterium glucuronolyticum ATCC 51866]QRP70535.1 HNH endonuclease [Corynebacterium glucuronolyticum]